jgi:predicted nucleotidyltransferase component of viral defense system
MIPTADILAWRAEHPWVSSAQVEQDLTIYRAVIELFSRPVLRDQLALRGGTALHKLFLKPAARYSEDIDLVQMKAGAIGPVMDGVHEALGSWLGAPRREQKAGNVTLTYRLNSEIAPVVPLRLKVEINTREHFTVLGLVEQTLAAESRWFTARAAIPTFALDELLGTKMRALYQRRKGRDLFDLWLGLTQGRANPMMVVGVFRKYVAAEGNVISGAEFEQNLAQKMKHAGFLSDLLPLLRPGIAYDAAEACRLLENELLGRLRSDGRARRRSRPSKRS